MMIYIIIVVVVAIAGFVAGVIFHDPIVNTIDKAKEKIADKLDDMSDKLDE